MTLESVLGFIAMTIQMAIMVLGYPLQIREMLAVPVVQGVSKPQWWLIVAAHATWMMYTYLREEWFLFAPNVPGLILSLVIISILYKKSPIKGEHLHEEPAV